MFVDFKTVRSKVSVHQAATFLRLSFKQSDGGWYRGWCPACEAHTLLMMPAYGVFFCATARKQGDCIGLVAHCKRMSIKDAALALCRHFGVRHAVHGTLEQEVPAKAAQ